MIHLQPIGVIRSPHVKAAGTPIQPSEAAEARGRVEFEAELEPALLDLEGFERVWLIYIFDRAAGFRPRVVPYRDSREHGTLATRAPTRPNPIGMSVVRVLGREGAVLHVSEIDVLDGTPLLDVKPYVPEFDAHPESRAGWFETATTNRAIADGRFHGGEVEGEEG